MFARFRVLSGDWIVGIFTEDVGLGKGQTGARRTYDRSQSLAFNKTGQMLHCGSRF